MLREAEKSVIFLVARPLRGGVGCKGLATKKKELFKEKIRFFLLLSSKGGGGKASVAMPLKKENFFCGLPYPTMLRFVARM